LIREEAAKIRELKKKTRAASLPKMKLETEDNIAVRTEVEDDVDVDESIMNTLGELYDGTHAGEISSPVEEEKKTGAKKKTRARTPKRGFAPVGKQSAHSLYHAY